MPLSNYAFLEAPPGSGSRYNPNSKLDFAYDFLKQAYVVPKTGALYTGPIGTTGNYSINGKWSATPPPNSASATDSGFSVTNTVRQPAIAALTDALTKQAAQQAASPGQS
jgi:hypothetical protein